MLGVVLGVVLLFCGFIGLGALVGGDVDDPAGTEAAGVVDATTEAATAEVPTVDDVTITAKITEKTCYGSGIGCTVDWIPVVEYSGPEITGDDIWAVSWEVDGLESGTAQGTTLVGSAGPAKQREKHGRTAGKSSKITVKVTGVELYEE